MYGSWHSVPALLPVDIWALYLIVACSVTGNVVYNSIWYIWNTWLLVICMRHGVQFAGGLVLSLCRLAHAAGWLTLQ